MAKRNDKSGTPLPERKTGKIGYTKVNEPIKPRPSTPLGQRAEVVLTVPWLNLKGNWLHEAGFEIATPIFIDVSPGRLVITIDTVAEAELERSML